jgi:hypothetical protein
MYSIYKQNLLHPFLFAKPSLFSIFLQDPPPINMLSPLPPLPPSFSEQAPVSQLEKAIVHNKKLRSKTALDYYKKKGLHWLQRHDYQQFPSILRNPTMGCMVELTSKPSLFTFHIDSREAKKIICRDCYF